MPFHSQQQGKTLKFFPTRQSASQSILKRPQANSTSTEPTPSTSNSLSSPSNSDKINEPTTTYAILMPYILDENLTPLLQPFLMKINVNSLRSFGYEIPFKDYFDEKNNFIIQIGKERLSAQIIAVADDLISLRSCLKRNVVLNTAWQSHEKILGNTELVMNIEHMPLELDETPIKHVIGKKKLYGLMKEFISDLNGKGKEKNQILTDEPTLSNERIENVQVNKKRVIKDQINDQGSENGKTTNDSFDLSMIEHKLKILNEKKVWLPEGDSLSSMVKNTLEVVNYLFSAIKKEPLSQKLVFKVSENDETYKIKKKNQIFIEGKIQFDLDRYTNSMLRSKPRNPAAIAYQLVHTAFPVNYYKNVTLGRKFYDEGEIETIHQDHKSGKVKIPLAFVLGYEDPYNAPFEGEFNIIRGQDRIRSLIDHIFRKAEIFQYDEESETKVRNRIGKELSSKNQQETKTKRKSLDTEQEENDEDRAENFTKNINDERERSKSFFEFTDTKDNDTFCLKDFEKNFFL